VYRLVCGGLILWALLGFCAANAIPEAGHVRIQCAALRLNVNNYSLRHQIKVVVSVSAPEVTDFGGIEESVLTITAPSGATLNFSPTSFDIRPRVFKAANATLLFKAIDDSADAAVSNVPSGFFDAAEPYTLVLTMPGRRFEGAVSFSRYLAMHVEQQGQPVRNFCLADETGMDLYTTPAEFGPVYYKHQDITNFVFQLANMDAAIESQDYHPPVESPRYIFQVRIGDGAGGPTQLLDPARYIDGYTSHLIRSERTSTPLHFAAEDFNDGDVVVVDFERQDTLEPDSVFSGYGEGYSSEVVVKDRIVYALKVEEPPTAEELGQVASSAVLQESSAAGDSGG